MRRGLIALVIFFSWQIQASAEETIVRFQSDVTVNTDASIDVAETIAVNSENQSIQHGIFRDIPTIYTDRNGISMRVDLSVKDVMRDGSSENYQVESIAGGLRIKIGNKDVMLSPGIHRYLIKYQATRELGFFETYDELYWNVVGGGWPFNIQQVDVTVHLPDAASIQNFAIYTGYQGSKGHEAHVSSSTGNVFSAQTTKVLQPQQDFTIAVAWQKGIVTPPSAQQRQLWWLQDNAAFGMLALTLAAVCAYFYYAWTKVGRDPPRGTIIPLFHPPENLGPAGVRYIWKQGCDDRTIAAALVGLAVKGRLTIDNSEDFYAVEKTASVQNPLLPSEAALYAALPANRLALLQTNHTAIAALKNAVERSLEKQFGNAMFLKNLGWFALGFLMSVAGLGLSFWLLTAGPRALAVMVTVTGLVAVINIIFYYLISAPTVPGRRVLDAIEGFKLYLTTAEEKRLDMLNPPEKTPALFERYLPYALALDCENAWNKKFTAVLAAAAVTGASAPLWYIGSGHGSWSNMGTSLGASLASTISSSSTAPGSSSGSSGGGSSGGGGGGGGGGGW